MDIIYIRLSDGTTYSRTMCKYSFPEIPVITKIIKDEDGDFMLIYSNGSYSHIRGVNVMEIHYSGMPDQENIRKQAK